MVTKRVIMDHNASRESEENSRQQQVFEWDTTRLNEYSQCFLPRVALS